MKLTTGDGVVFLRPIHEGLLEDVTILYNSSIRYATGLDQAVSIGQIQDMLLNDCSCSDEFSSGIFISSDNPCSMKFVGLVTGLVRDNRIWVKLLAVLPQFRRQGIGTGAVELILEYSRKYWGVTEAFLSVAEKNDEGLHFWTKQGFSATASLRKVLFEEETKQKVIIMNKKCV